MTNPFGTVQVATAGEALIDMILNAAGQYEPCLGGAVYNFTRALSRQGVATMYLNPLANDRLGGLLRDALVQDGVVLGQPVPVDEVTSLAMVALNAQGHPSYAFYRQGVADRATTASQLDDICQMTPSLSMVCTGALALAPDDAPVYLPWLRSQRAAGRTIVLDVNMRPSAFPDLSAYRLHALQAVRCADIIKVSDEDMEHLQIHGATSLEQARALLHQSSAALLTLTLGAKGACLLTRHGQAFHAVEEQAPRVVDTVGAGDCFLAGFLAAMLELNLSHEWGSSAVAVSHAQAILNSAIASASLCVMRRGCQPPTRAEVRQRMDSSAQTFRDLMADLAPCL